MAARKNFLRGSLLNFFTLHEKQHHCHKRQHLGSILGWQHQHQQHQNLGSIPGSQHLLQHQSLGSILGWQQQQQHQHQHQQLGPILGSQHQQHQNLRSILGSQHDHQQHTYSRSVLGSQHHPYQQQQHLRSVLEWQHMYRFWSQIACPNTRLHSPVNLTSDKPGFLNSSKKLGAIGSSACWSENTKLHESLLLNISKYPANFKQSIRLDASKHNTGKLFSIICSRCTFSPRPVLRITVGIDTSKAIFSEVQGADIGNTRSLSTIADKESHSGQKFEEPSKTLDDFQHEEIVGPTVEKDLSATANELRECLKKLTDSISHLTSAFMALGLLQLVGSLYTGIFVSPNHYPLLFMNISGVVVTISLAYLLRLSRNLMLFFSKLEERSRLRIVTLSVQVIKAFFEFVGRANVVVRLASVGVLVTLLAEIWLLYKRPPL